MFLGPKFSYGVAGCPRIKQCLPIFSRQLVFDPDKVVILSLGGFEADFLDYPDLVYPANTSARGVLAT